MAEGAFKKAGAGSLSASAPGVISTVDVTLTGVAAGDHVFLTQTNTVKDAKGEFVPKVSAVTTNKVTVTAGREQLPSALTFNVIAFEGP